MAQFVFDANKYANGTLLSQLDWVSGFTPAVDYIVTEIGATGRKYWNVTTTTLIQYATMPDSVTDYELLLLSDFTLAEAGGSMHGFELFFAVAAADSTTTSKPFVRAFVNGSNAIAYFAGSGLVSTLSTDTAPTSWLASRAVACRHQYVTSGSTFRVRFWQAELTGLQAAEPGTWNVVGSMDTPVAAAAPTPRIYSGVVSRFSVISIGTAGDVAPYPNAALTVTTPPTPAASNITATTADIDWT